jgi:hypothetical protein
VTAINKEHGRAARNARVTIQTKGFDPAAAAAIFLTAPYDDAAAISGVKRGDAAITNNVPWDGEWTKLNLPTYGQAVLEVPSSSAAIVKLSAR